MIPHRIEIKRSAAKELEAVPRKDRKRIVSCAKLSEQEKYRIRQGNYRILYQVFDESAVVVVIKITG
ncbi:MAG: type II toxin-antitoxin system mRNA interferase toxin, RelE/StbE family [Meiothermus sp.]